jgi:CTP synthase
MRLGLRPTVFQEGTETWSKARKLYADAPKIWERHRHRYEVNPEWVDRLEAAGLSFTGKDEKGERMQILELKSAFFFHHTYGVLLTPHVCVLLRPSFLPWTASSPGILHASAQSFTTFSRLRRCGVW